MFLTRLSIRYQSCEQDILKKQGDHLSGKHGMSGNLTAVSKMSGILLKIREMSGKKSCQGTFLKLFIVSWIFASIQVFSSSLFCVKY